MKNFVLPNLLSVLSELYLTISSLGIQIIKPIEHLICQLIFRLATNMPKEGRNRSFSFDSRSRASPYPCTGLSSRHRDSSSSSSQRPSEPHVASAKDMKEWDEVRCPVCMEHPHNAVLLVCASGDKGCQPFMCDTSYRHSNCLDQYKKAFSGSSSTEENVGDGKTSKLSCPLCRGGVTGLRVVELSRKYMNSKLRSCSKESCGFTGSYGDLRKHARKEHPLVRPSQADPEREQDWRRMEQRRDLGDLFSMMQWVIGGEDGEFESLFEDEEDAGTGSSIFRISPIAVFFIVRFSGLGSATTSRGQLPSVSTRSRRGRGTILWGETYGAPEPASDIVSSSGAVVDGDGSVGDGEDADAESENVGGSNEVADSSRRGQRRPRRQLRLPDDWMDEDDLL